MVEYNDSSVDNELYKLKLWIVNDKLKIWVIFGWIVEI